MSITFVNGYLCTSSCDVAKAKRGVDPHPKADPREADGKADRSDRIGAAPGSNDPAVVFGGSLVNTALNATHRGDGAAAAATQTTSLLVDFLA